jgi:hypothetical protein
MRQGKEIKELFRAKIAAKIEHEKAEMHKRIDEEIPSWARWAVKPLAGLVFDVRRNRDMARGSSGEDAAALRFWLLLPNSWVVVNDVVLEPEPDDFVQIDHVIIGPPGIFLVETKAWEGAFLGYKDNWKRKEGNSWVPCESPTKQNMRHKRLFVEWAKGKGLASQECFKEYVMPVVLFTRARWLKTEGCSMPVFSSGVELVGYLRRHARENTVFSDVRINVIAEAIANSKTLCAEFGVEKIEKVEVNKGKYCVRVLGRQEKADLVREMYSARGLTATKLFQDRREQGWWCFYVEKAGTRKGK